MTTDEKKTILVVDDDEGIRTLLADRLTMDHFNVLIAANGLHAYQTLANRKSVNLMICDVNMPGLSGVQLLEKVNNTPNILPFPVIMLTANRDREVVIRAAKTGVVEYLLKPFKYNDILEKIRKILEPEKKTGNT